MDGEVGWREGWTEKSPRTRCREQFESSCAERAEVCFACIEVTLAQRTCRNRGGGVSPCSVDVALELWSLSGVSDWERLSTAAASGSCWVKAPRYVQWWKSLRLSSRNDGKLPKCPGMLSRLSG